MSDLDHNEDVFKRLGVLARCIASVFGKTCEVVVHDLRRAEHSVVDIVNGHITGRTVGSPLLEGPMHDRGMEVIVIGGPPDKSTGAYRTRTKEGRELKSSTGIFYDDNGEPLAALCINWDLTLLRNFSEFIDLVNAGLPSLERNGEDTEVKSINPEDVARETIDGVIQEYAKPTYLMKREDRLQVIHIMYRRGVFLIKNSVEMVAQALDVSKNTVYGYVSEVKQASKSMSANVTQ